MKKKAIIFTAPSGAGKTTIVRHLIKTFPQLAFSVSATTRPPRNGEINGKDYYFLSEDEFKEKIAQQQFLEWEEVYPGRFYGTLLNEIERLYQSGKVVVFDVDVKGAWNIKNKLGPQALSVFVKAPSIDILIDRLKARLTENSDELQKRIDRMYYEMTFEERFDKVLINDSLQETFRCAEKLVRSFLDSSR